MVMTGEKWRILEKRESAEVLATMIEGLMAPDTLRVLLEQNEIGDAAMQAVLNDVLPSLGVMAAQLLRTSIMDANIAIRSIEDHLQRPQRRLSIAFETELQDMG